MSYDVADFVTHDITFCDNPTCPFTDCARHIKHLEGKRGIYSISNFYAVCRKYISYLFEDSEDMYLSND